MSELDLVAITPYGRQAGSSRVRVYDWFDHFGYLNHSVNSYINTADAGTRTLIAHPAQVLEAEAALRTLARRPTNRLLLHREASPFSRGGSRIDSSAMPPSASTTSMTPCNGTRREVLEPESFPSRSSVSRRCGTPTALLRATNRSPTGHPPTRKTCGSFPAA